MKPFALNNPAPPTSICLVRLSAIGDVTHMLPIINTIRSSWPRTKITWVIGKTEFELVRDLIGVEFVVFDKSCGVGAYRALRQRLRHRSFDLLLIMQLSLRANLIFPLINASLKVGFEQKNCKALYSLLTDYRIPLPENQHVLDTFFSFTRYLGINEKRLIWDVCCSDEERNVVATTLLREVGDDARMLLINPCSSRTWRNWPPERYAEIAEHAAKTHAMRIVLTGGNSPTERVYGQRIGATMVHSPINLIGKTTLRQLVAVIERADIVIAPDSGPAHLASCAGKPVIGLYAASNPDRTAPYLSRRWCVDRYPDAVRLYLKKNLRSIPWGTKIKDPDVMKLITFDDVRQKLDSLAHFKNG